MKEFWNVIQLIFTAVGGWLGWFLGGCDGLLYALIAFVVVQFIVVNALKVKAVRPLALMCRFINWFIFMLLADFTVIRFLVFVFS